MKTRLLVGGMLVFAFLLAVSISRAQRAALLPPVAQAGKDDPKQKGKEKDKDKDKEKDKKQPEKKPAQPESDVFAPVFVQRTEAPTGYNPHMIGDWNNKFARLSVPFISTKTTTISTFGVSGVFLGTTTKTDPVGTTRTVLVSIPNQGAFKVAENASPRPQDRIFGFYNFYSDIRSPRDVGPITTQTTVDTTGGRVGAGTITTTTTTTPGAPRFVNLNRAVAGFEKTFLDGRASVEMRLPYNWQGDASTGGFGYTQLGDLFINLKYALILNPDNGNVVSTGLAVTAPTGRPIDLVDGQLRESLIQPWFGYIVNFDRFFVQAFHSVVIPTDSRDVTLLFNDVGLSYWLYRDEGRGGLVRFIVPTAEAHITTPLNHRDIDSNPIIVTDAVVLTGGVHVGLGRGSILTFGVGSPVTGPRPYGMEAFVQYNLRF